MKMKKYYIIVTLIFMLSLFECFIPVNAASSDNELTGKIGNNSDSYKYYEITLDERRQCEFIIESISGKGNIRFLISSGDEDDGSFDYHVNQIIYLSNDGDCTNNKITTTLDEGEYTLQISLDSDTSSEIEYKIKTKYFEPKDTLEISESNLEMASGDNRTLMICKDGYPLYADELIEIKWSSNNKKIATIDKYGYITARAHGKCVITGIYKGKSYTCSVNVLNTNFTIVNNKINIKYGERREIEFQSTPEVASLYVFPEYYSTSNKNVAVFDFDENEIIAKGKGTCKITFTFYNGQEKTCTVNVGNPTFKQQLESQVAYALDTFNIRYNRYSNEYIAGIYINNRKGKDITYVEFAVFQYDNKGTRINRLDSNYNYNGTISKKGSELVNCSVHSNTKKVHACIKKVYYEDGKTWTNPLFSKWSKKYGNNF